MLKGASTAGLRLVAPIFDGAIFAPADLTSEISDEQVTVVSDEFDGKMLIARHRIINKILAEELAGAIHALSIHSFTPAEWSEKNEQSRQSPPCLGGAKREQSS